MGSRGIAQKGREQSGGFTHGVTGGIFLLGGDDAAGALGLVQGSFAADNSFSLGGPTAGLTANFRNGVPIV